MKVKDSGPQQTAYIPIPLITSLKPHEAKANKNIIVGNQ